MGLPIALVLGGGALAYANVPKLEGAHPEVRDVDVGHDRVEAILAAVRDASARDVVVVAGKGHESEQVIGGTQRSFSDCEVAREAVRASPGSRAARD